MLNALIASEQHSKEPGAPFRIRTRVAATDPYRFQWTAFAFALRVRHSASSADGSLAL